MDSKTDLMRRKLAVIDLMSRGGWRIVCDLAEETVRQMERAALDEEDDVRGSALRREAKAARKFLVTFLNAVETTSRLEVEPSAGDANLAGAEVDDHYELSM